MDSDFLIGQWRKESCWIGKFRLWQDFWWGKCQFMTDLYKQFPKKCKTTQESLIKSIRGRVVFQNWCKMKFKNFKEWFINNMSCIIYITSHDLWYDFCWASWSEMNECGAFFLSFWEIFLLLEWPSWPSTSLHYRVGHNCMNCDCKSLKRVWLFCTHSKNKGTEMLPFFP